MPWTVEDVDRFKRGLNDEQKKRWVEIANKALAACLKKSEADDIDCEVKAIKQANGSFSDEKPDFANFSNPLRPADHKEPNRYTFAEVNEEAEYQLAFPIGAWQTGKYGEVIVTRTFAERMVDNWKNKVLGNRNVYMDTNHDFGEAAAWAEDMRVTDDGLEVKWDFNNKGKELIGDRRYRFYSAAIGFAVNVQTGDEAFPVLHAVSLTNDPVMNTMPQAHLSDKSQPSAHSDGGKNTPREGNMELTFADVLEYLKDAKDSEKDVVLKELGAADAHAQVMQLTADVKRLTGEKETLVKANEGLTTEVNGLRAASHKARKDEVIGKALSEGRILPKDKEYWEGRFDENAEFTADVLNKLPKAVDFKEHGTGTGGGEGTFDAEAFAVYRRFNPELSEEEARKAFAEYSKGVI